MSALRLIVGLMAAVAVVSFGVMNMDPVAVKYHRIGTLEFPLLYVILGFFVAGFFLAWLGGIFDRIRFYARLTGYRRQVRTLSREIEEMRLQSDRLLPPPSQEVNGEAGGALSVPGGEPGRAPAGGKEG